MTTTTKQLPILRARKKNKQDDQLRPTAYSEPFLEYRGRNIPVETLEDQSVDPSMLGELHMDLVSRAQLPPKLTNEALIETAEHYANQCSADGVAVTYDQMLVQHILPELVERLKEK